MLKQVLIFFFLIIPLPPRSTLFPYTTLFRSGLTSRFSFSCRNDWYTLIRVCFWSSVSDWSRRMWSTRSRSRRSEEHTSELQSRQYLVCRLLLEKKKYGQHTGTASYTSDRNLY